jgi:hypothetical protein
MKAGLVPLGIILLLTAALSVACAESGAEYSATTTPAATELTTITPTSTPTSTPIPTPTATPSKYDRDINAIEAAIAQYHASLGQWPTADGQPGDIDWDKLVPTYLDTIPSTDSRCDWYVSSDPPGTVCRHGCSPCGCPGGEACK